MRARRWDSVLAHRRACARSALLHIARFRAYAARATWFISFARTFWRCYFICMLRRCARVGRWRARTRQRAASGAFALRLRADAMRCYYKLFAYTRALLLSTENRLLPTRITPQFLPSYALTFCAALSFSSFFRLARRARQRRKRRAPRVRVMACARRAATARSSVWRASMRHAA